VWSYYRPVLLSATLIVQDESEYLPGCLASLASVVDEIVVVDTGSTDTTAEIARAAGAIVATHPWDGHFADARNAALDLAHGQWILYIDADERLSAAEKLRDHLAESDAIAGLVRFRPGRRFTRYLEYRLFRNRPDIRFRGAIHETTVPDIERLVANRGGVVTDVPAQIDHLGYEGDQEPKHRRNLPLLQRELLDDPERIYLWYHLGAVHDGLGDSAAAEAAWAQGVAVTRRKREPGKMGLLVFVKLIMIRLRAGDDAAELVEELRARYPDDPLTVWAASQEAIAGGRWGDAVPLLEQLVAIDADELIHPRLAYDERMFGELAAYGLGTCWFQLGDNAAAERWFGRAAAAAPDIEEYRVKRLLAAARAAPDGGTTAPALW
jgi:tetratricopeptide (TPR) repeat protein